MDWFREQYAGSTGTPLMVHPQRRFDSTAAVPTGCRVITTDKLGRLRDALAALTTALADTDAFRDPARVSQLLHTHGLTAESFVMRHTVAAHRAPS
jgi:hypothetical protein